MIRHYNPKEIGLETIIDFLKRSAQEYPCEVGEVNLTDWPQKLNSFADVFCHLDNNGLITAALFFYCNDLKSKKAYIPFICSLHFNPKGIAYQLHNEYLNYSRSHGMDYSCLEVLKTNTHARAFYKRQGYSIKEDHKEKLLLQLILLPSVNTI